MAVESVLAEVLVTLCTCRTCLDMLPQTQTYIARSHGRIADPEHHCTCDMFRMLQDRIPGSS